MSQFANHPDVIIVGGGPAGLAAAIAAREKGFRVLVADCSAPPMEKPCGEGLMPNSLAALARLGVAAGAAPSFPFSGIRFCAGGYSVEAGFPSGVGRGIRRNVLHQLLVDRAREVGADFCWNARVASIARRAVTINGETVPCRWIVGADGQKSIVRRWAGLDRTRYSRRRFGFRRHYRVAPWTDRMELHWGDGCQFYITPVHSGEVCVVVMSRDRHLRMDAALENFPELQGRLAGAPANRERGALISTASYEKVARGDVFLIGDASGSVDAITGHGLCLSFQQAFSLAAAMESGRVEQYQEEHRKLMRRPMFMGELLLALDRFPWLRRRAIETLAAHPDRFAHLLSAHVGEEALSGVVLHGLLPLAWGMLAAG